MTAAKKVRVYYLFVMKIGFLKISALPAALIAIMLIFQPPDIARPSLAAAVIHECGHLFAARVLGIGLHSLEIGPLGATIKTHGALISYGREWALCAAGPGANLISAALTYLLFADTAGFSSHGTAFNFFAVSLSLAALNLLPIDGFDGGRMLAASVCRTLGPRASAAMVDAGTLLSLLMLWGFSVYLLLCHGSSLSLFVFSASVFCRVFLEGDR